MSMSSLTQGSLGGSNGLPDPIGNFIASLGGGEFDPLNAFAVNQPGGANYQAKYGSPVPTSIPTLSGGTTGTMPGWNGKPVSYPSQLGTQSANLGPGQFNAMAAQLAGPLYNPGIPSAASPPQGKGGVAPAPGSVSPSAWASFAKNGKWGAIP